MVANEAIIIVLQTHKLRMLLSMCGKRWCFIENLKSSGEEVIRTVS
jgi:hypothetical protein